MGFVVRLVEDDLTRGAVERFRTSDDPEGVPLLHPDGSNSTGVDRVDTWTDTVLVALVDGQRVRGTARSRGDAAQTLPGASFGDIWVDAVHVCAADRDHPARLLVLLKQAVRFARRGRHEGRLWLSLSEELAAQLGSLSLVRGEAPDTWMVPQHSLPAAFVEPEWQPLDPRSERRVEDRGSTLFLAGTTADAAFQVIRGTVRLEFPGPGPEPKVLTRVGPGQILGERSVLPGRRYTVTAVVDAEQCDLEWIEDSSLQRSLEQDAVVRRRFHEALLARLNQLVHRPLGVAAPGEIDRVRRILVDRGGDDVPLRWLSEQSGLGEQRLVAAVNALPGVRLGDTRVQVWDWAQLSD